MRAKCETCNGTGEVDPGGDGYDGQANPPYECLDCDGFGFNEYEDAGYDDRGHPDDE